ncbi:MAG: hypothetical protein ACJ8EE_04870 [Bradyrhizobium sp.]
MRYRIEIKVYGADRAKCKRVEYVVGLLLKKELGATAANTTLTRHLNPFRSQRRPTGTMSGRSLSRN